MHLRRFYPLPQVSGGGGVLAMTLFPGDPTEQFNPLVNGFSTVFEDVGVTGGTAPYVYSATYVSGSTEILAGDAGTNFVSFFASGDGTGPVNTKEAVWRFTVTDSLLASVFEDCVIRFVFGLEPP